MVIRDFDFLNDRQFQILLQKVAKNSKYRLLTVLMAEGGMRVTEAASLRLSNLHFREKMIRVKCLKKKGDVWRDVPMSARVVQALADYLASYKGDRKDGNLYLFPGYSSNGKPLGRRTIWHYYNRLKRRVPELLSLHPHALRHTFATRLVNSGVSLVAARELLGHRSVQTTEIYTHIPVQLLRGSISVLDGRPSFFSRLFSAVFGAKNQNVDAMTLGISEHKSLLVGREKELLRMDELIEKKVNILVTGAQGIGKSQLLDNLKLKDRKVVRMDEIKSVKIALVGFAMHILNDKENLKKMLYSDAHCEAKLTKDTSKNLIDLLKKITEPQEYTVIVDDVTDITRGGVKVLEFMRNHFHLIVGARQIKIDKASFLTNFERVELKALKRSEALELIHRLSYDVIGSIENYELFQNHIVEQTNGNPQYIYEIISRYRKEPYISNQLVRGVRHTAALPEIDFTPVIVIALAALMIMRYFGREIGESGYQLIGGAALIFALFARQFFRAFKKRFI